MKVLTHIDCPKEWESENDWDSHRPLLWLATEIIDYGWVTEFGCGFGSTLLLYDKTRKEYRGFISYENNPEWLKQPMGRYINIVDYKTIKPLPDKNEVIFIDCAPAEERKVLIDKYKYLASVIVVHDSEETSSYVYGMSEILSTFKYRIDYRPEGKPHTTAVSNFIDVEKWVE